VAGISIETIHKAFQHTNVLEGVSINIDDGEFLTLVGPSGCGKSTLLRIIAGLEYQDSGSISISGRNVDAVPPKERDLAMVFQSYALYPYMSVAQNIALPLTMRRLSGLQRLPLVGRFLPGAGQAIRSIAADVAAVAESLGVGHLLDRRPGQLSGGQRQRVALARAMVRQPRAFLMDEPLSNLDAKLRVQARAEISDLHRRLGTTFIYVTHDQAEALTMSDRVAVMMDGRLLQVDSPQRIYDEPATVQVARFIGTPEINVIPATIRADRSIEVAGRAWPVSVQGSTGTAISVAVRPEALSVDVRPHGHLTLSGSVRHVELLGSETLLHIDVEGLASCVIARVEPRTGAGYRLGDSLQLSADGSRVLAFDGNGQRLHAQLGTSVPRLVENARG
jgi:multiple sugar transport system ATP-binding protein